MEVFDLMSKLHKSTDSALMENQLAYIPVVYELEQNSNPDVLELKHALKRTNSYRILQRQQLVRYNNLKETMFLSADDLYNNGICRKIICVNEEGYMVDQSTISIAVDGRNVYINSNDLYAKLKWCIVFMEDVKYDDSNPIFYIYNNKFYTNCSEGFCISCKDLLFETLIPTSEFIEPIKISNGYKIFKENIFVFKNGLFQGNNVVRLYGNVFQILDYNETDKWFCYIIYKEDKECIDNINKLESKINLLDSLLKEVPSYIDELQEGFDFEPDNTKSYQENLRDILEYISNYNHEGMLEYYLENNNTIIEEYTGQYMISKKKNDMFYISRRRKQKMYNYIIVYVNGLLYQYHDEIEYGITTIGIPIKDIDPNDEIIIQFFLDCNDKMYDITFNKDNKNVINHRLLSSDPDNIEFYSPEFEGRHLYDLTVDERRQMKVPYEYDIENDSMVIELKNPYLYGKSLKMGSKRKFKHQTVKTPKKYSNTLNMSNYSIDHDIVIDSYDQLDEFFNIDKFNTESITNSDSILSYTTDNISEKYLSKNVPNTIQKYFAMRLYGYIWVENPDEYDISIVSLNSVKVYIDDEVKISLLSSQIESTPFEESKSKCTVYLDRGFHKINIYTLNITDCNQFTMAWKSKNKSDYEIIKNNILYRDLPDYYIIQLHDTDFRYCLEYNHYLLFYNRRRLYANEAYIKVSGIDQVYDQAYLFISKPIPEDSEIEIFYLPDIVQEIYNAEKLSSDGYITIEKDELMNTFHPELCGVFVNGKLINPKYMKNLNTNTLRITSDINTLGEVSVLKYNMYDDYANSIFEYANDIWTKVTNDMDKDILNQYINGEEIHDNETNFYNPPCIDLIWAIVKKYWIDRFELIDAELLFQYNDDPKILRKTKDRHTTIESYEYEIPSSISYKLYDKGYHKYHKFVSNGNGQLSFGIFKNLDANKKYSLSFSASLYMNIHGEQKRIFCEVFDNNGNKTQIPLKYNSDEVPDIKDIPKCYFIRLYLNDIPITDTKNNIRIICKLNETEEYIEFKDGVFLEESSYSIRNIESIPIDASIKTGVRLPYGHEFDKE